MFHLSGTAFEDDRLPINIQTFARPEFDALQATGAFKNNMDSVPLLTYNGVAIGQSMAIKCFVARHTGFMGTSDVEAARIQNVCENLRDISDAFKANVAGKDGEAKEAAKASFDLKWWVNALERSVDGYTSGDHTFAVGSKLSLADLEVHTLFTAGLPGMWMYGNNEAVATALKDCPTLTAIIATVDTAAKSYFESRPASAF